MKFGIDRLLAEPALRAPLNGKRLALLARTRGGTRIRALGALAISAPLFFVVFSTAYYLMDQTYPGSWTEPMTRLDAVYFTVTTFTTVGFGDITAVSQPARIVVTVQMLGGLVIVGLVARAFINAMQTGLQRREANRRSNRRR